MIFIIIVVIVGAILVGMVIENKTWRYFWIGFVIFWVVLIGACQLLNSLI